MLPELDTHTTIGALAYDAIRLAILNRRLKAGSRLVVDRLADELKISRTPVKEALAKLEREGLVVVIPHRGAYVVNITKRDIEEVYSLREVIEGLAARMAALNISGQDLRELRALVQRGETALASRDFNSYTEIDLAWHRKIRLASENRRLHSMMDNLDGQVRILMSTSAAVPGRGLASVGEHLQVVAALEARNPQAAGAAMQKHVANAKHAILAHWKDDRESPALEAAADATA